MFFPLDARAHDQSLHKSVWRNTLFFPLDARAHDQSRRQKTALLQAEIRKAVKRSVVAGSSFDRLFAAGTCSEAEPRPPLGH